jgi:hypothetical protein
MQFHAIHIQGNILSAELLDQIQNEQQTAGQSPRDFWLDPGAKVRDEIQRAWADVKDQYQIFRRRQEKLKEGDNGRADTRKYWMLDFFDYLGYKLEPAPEEPLNGKAYHISHRAANLNGLPVHIAGIRESLDKKPDGRGSMSPHALVQEYLNVTEHVYGLVTNGAQLRLLRDSSRLTRLSYLEFDLTKILEEDRYADFALLYRLLHASRMPRTASDAPASLIERYHTDSLAAGSRIREKLSGSVEFAISTFANGFLKHPDNDKLRQAFQEDTLRPDGLYDELLRLIYRLLFLMVTEERNLIFPDPDEQLPMNTTESDKRQIYYRYYAVNRLRQLAEKRLYDQQRYSDLWDGLLHTFRLFEAGEHGKALGIAPLAGDLFSSRALTHLGQCRLDNESLLRAVFLLSAFENEQKQIIRVNYAGLDVEEFGSVYEGLLEYQPAVVTHPWQFQFEKGSARSSSGSHYTPEELVHPLIKHSLDYLIEDRLKQDPTGERLLTLKVADVACGSGHILLAAARRIALELARARTQEDQPAPAPYRRALREVVQHCIYGVDKNPLAVELCKVALWLEAHNPGQPLNFLDHRIRCGDAIVGVGRAEDLDKGIPDEAFKTLPGDDKEVAARLRKANAAARKGMEAIRKANRADLLSKLSALGAEWKSLDTLEENTVQAVEAKRKHYENLRSGAQWWRLKQLADIATAQFFIPKTPENELFLSTEKDFREYSSGRKALQTQAAAKAVGVAGERHFFHWFLEFPEVMAQGGFDCVVGNPPFLGDKKLKSTLGEQFMEIAKHLYSPIGAVDLVTYFFRRIFNLIREKGFLSLISTNTIAQGSTREGGLEVIVNNGGSINHAVRTMKWPGKAAVEVSIVSITKQLWNKDFSLGTKKVKTITAFLDDNQSIGTPYQLSENAEKSFIGSYVLGSGFVLEPKLANKLIKENPINKNVIFPFLNGEDLNNSPKQEPSRWVINFFGWPERRMTENEWRILDENSKQEIENKIRGNKTILLAPPNFNGSVAADYQECYEIVHHLVKPERQRWAIDKSGKELVGEFAVRAPMPERWWIYGEKRPGLYNKIKHNKRVIVIALTSKTVAFSFLPNGIVYSHATVVISFEKALQFSILQSGIHRQWVDNYASKMKTDQRYTPSDCFENYPFPQNIPQILEQELEAIGETYHEYRRQLMLGMWLGLTKTYNLFHARALPAPEQAAAVAALPHKDIEKQYGKDTAHLVKHLAASKEATYTLEQSLAGIHRLRALHVEMDQAVLEAYGWSDIALRHDFYEVDYLPENDRVRYTIHPEARKEVLKRLLELNHQLYAEEVARGLHEKNKKTNKKSVSDVEDPSLNYPDEDGKMFEDGKQGKLF